jgi:hypothetical protein
MTTATHIQTELGATVNYDRNLKKAKQEGLQSCAHCGKGMVEGTGFLVRIISMKGLLIPFDSTEGEIVRIGSTCLNKFAVIEKMPTTHYAKVGA